MYAEYNARAWAEGRTVEEIKAEIQRVKNKFSHHYQWNEVGCRTFDYIREETLKIILFERIK